VQAQRVQEGGQRLHDHEHAQRGAREHEEADEHGGGAARLRAPNTKSKAFAIVGTPPSYMGGRC
jgi:hypothetical protein